MLFDGDRLKYRGREVSVKLTQLLATQVDHVISYILAIAWHRRRLYPVASVTM